MVTLPSHQFLLTQETPSSAVSETKRNQSNSYKTREKQFL